MSEAGASGTVRPTIVRDAPDRDRGDVWAEARAALSGLPGGGLNIAHETVDRHATGGRADRTALRVVHRSGEVTEVTYGELRRRTNRFAAVLRDLGVGRGRTVFTLLGRGADMHVAALGTLKAGCVLSPLFAAFGPEPELLADRMRIEGSLDEETWTALERDVAAELDAAVAAEAAPLEPAEDLTRFVYAESS